MATLTVTITPTDIPVTQRKEELQQKYADVRLRKRGTVYPHDLINEIYGGSHQVLTDFIEVYGSWANAYQELEGSKCSWKGEYPDISQLLKWCAAQLGHAPSMEDRNEFRKLGVLPTDQVIQARFARKDFAAIYRMAGLPKAGDDYTSSR